MLSSEDAEAFIHVLLENYLIEYWENISKSVSENAIDGFPLYVSDPSEIVLYLGKTHLAIEYLDNGNKSASDELHVRIQEYIDRENLFPEIVRIQFDGNSEVVLPISGIFEHVFVPTLEADKILVDARWHTAAQMLHQTSVLIFNSSGFQFPTNEYASLRNCLFYGTDENGLIVRHIKWLDVFPIEVF